MAPTIHRIDRHGVAIGYRIAGNGPTIVLLHGLAGHSGEWRETIETLAFQYQVIAIDQRGHGLSSRIPSDVSRGAFAADVIAVLDACACRAPATIVGQSMGAHTAMLVAAWHPARINRLVMVEGGVGGGGAAAAERLHEKLAGWPPHFKSRTEARDFFGGDTPSARAWADLLELRDGHYVPHFSRATMDSVMAPIFDHEWWPEWQTLTAPAHIVLAENSRIDAAQVERMRNLQPTACLQIIPGTGHDLHLEQPTAWQQALQSALKDEGA